MLANHTHAAKVLCIFRSSLRSVQSFITKLGHLGYFIFLEWFPFIPLAGVENIQPVFHPSFMYANYHLIDIAQVVLVEPIQRLQPICVNVHSTQNVLSDHYPRHRNFPMS